MKTLATLFAVVIAVTLGGLAPSEAQIYPSKPIRVITANSAGGTSDIFVRALGEELHKRLGQPLIIENRSGGVEAGKRHNARELPDLQNPHLAFAQKGQVSHVVEIVDRMQMRVIGRR